MKILLSHPTGNEFVRAATVGFYKKGILAEFSTAIATYPNSLFDRLSVFKPLSELSRRRFDPALQPLTKTYPWRELGRHAACKSQLHSLTKHETGFFSVDAVYNSIDRKVAKRLARKPESSFDAVYSYEDSALQSFLQSKEIGLSCFYDLPIGYWRTARQLLEREREILPDWSSTLTGFQDSDAKLARKDDELKLADRIFVASRFTAKTLTDYPGTLAPVEVIPYGFPPVCSNREYPSFSKNRPLKLLFVGSLSQRKGIANLFAATEALAPFIELTVVGRKTSNSCKALNMALNRHKWYPSLSNQEVLQLMRVHDTLVFPSLFEGFGLVITEAMSQGTPVITTDRTAGPDLIQQGQNGWLVEAGSTEALQATIEFLLHHPAEIRKNGREAVETARKRPWDVYGKELAEAVLSQSKIIK